MSKQRRGSRASRRAYTLIEMLVVIGIISFVLTTVTVTLHTLSRVSREMRQSVPRSAALLLLSLQVREDAHAALDFTVETPAEGVVVGRFTLSDRENVLYESKPSSLVRRLLRNGEQVHQELFRLPQDATIAWEQSAATPQLVTLRLKHSASRVLEAPDTQRLDRIDAALGIRNRAR